jgi:hypothetical protein
VAVAELLLDKVKQEAQAEETLFSLALLSEHLQQLVAVEQLLTTINRTTLLLTVDLVAVLLVVTVEQTVDLVMAEDVGVKELRDKVLLAV